MFSSLNLGIFPRNTNRINREILFSNPVPNNVWRSGTPYSGTITIPTGTTLVGWVIKDNRTGTGIASGSTLSVTNTFTFASTADSNEYDLYVTVSKGLAMYTRIFDFEFYCLPALFTEGTANVVWDLASAVGNKDGGWTDRAPGGYKIWIKNAGVGRLNPYYWYSSDPTKWIHAIFDPATCSIASTTFNLTPGPCQNMIWDGCADPTKKYGMPLTKSDGGTQPLFTLLVSDTVRNSKNVIVCGFEANGRNVTGDSTGFQWTGTNNSVNNYDTYAADNIRMFHCYAYDTHAEGVYLGHFDDYVHGSYAYSAFSNCTVSRIVTNATGNDGIQFGSLIDSKVAKCSVTNAGTRNQQSHRNAYQFSSGNRNLQFYANYCDTTKNILSYFTGRRGQPVRIFSNLFYTTGKDPSSGVNVFIKMEQNDTYSTIDSSITHNTLIISSGLPWSLYNDTPGPITTVFNKLALGGNLITTNTATTKETVDGFVTTNLTEANLQYTNTTSPQFVSVVNKDFRLSTLSSPAFTAISPALVSNSDRDLYDYWGYQYTATDVMGADSGAMLFAA